MKHAYSRYSDSVLRSFTRANILKCWLVYSASAVMNFNCMITAPGDSQSTCKRMRTQKARLGSQHLICWFCTWKSCCWNVSTHCQVFLSFFPFFSFVCLDLTVIVFCLLWTAPADMQTQSICRNTLATWRFLHFFHVGLAYHVTMLTDNHSTWALAVSLGRQVNLRVERQSKQFQYSTGNSKQQSRLQTSKRQETNPASSKPDVIRVWGLCGWAPAACESLAEYFSLNMSANPFCWSFPPPN